MFRWLGEQFDTGKKIIEGIGAVVLALGAVAGSWYWVDGRWDQRAIAGEARQLQGQVNYQINELKLGQAKQNLETWQQKWLDFQLKSPADRASPIGRQYEQVITDKIGQYKSEVQFYEQALQRDKR